MKPIHQASPSIINWRRIAILVAWSVIWGGSMFVALSLSRVRSPWSGLLCGPWGCTAPLEAIVACHLAWLLVFLPGVAGLWRFGVRTHLLAAGGVLLLAGLSGMLLLWTDQLRTHSSARHPDLWRSTGLAIVCEVDYPIIPLLATGLLALCLFSWTASHGPASNHTHRKNEHVPNGASPS